MEISFDISETFSRSADLKTINGTEKILIKLIIAVNEIEEPHRHWQIL